MECGACRRDNHAGAMFCSGCGAALTRICASCRAPAGAADRFCSACGQPLSAASHAPEALRRRATVMFCDLSGYTALNEALDPEDVEPIMSHIKAAAIGIVEELGGTVNQFVGDEVMALFGMPVAHGDDACRAVAAARRLHDMMDGLAGDVLQRTGMEISLHTAIHTGLLVGRRRDDREGRYTVTGDTVNACARLLELARPGDVLVGPETQRMIAERFTTEELAPVRVRGKKKPIRPHRVIAERRLEDVPGARRFIGRHAELGSLQALIDQVATGAGGRIALVRGEAGIGKSALVGELRRVALEAGFACHVVLVLDFGVGRGRDAIAALVAGLLALDPAEHDDARRRAAVDAAVGERDVTPDQRAFVDDLLGLPPRPALRGIYEAMDDDTRLLGRQRALLDLAKRRCARAPLLVVVEDLHWAERTTLDHVLRLAELAAGREPLLLTVTTRPVHDQVRSALAPYAPFVLDLGFLPIEEARALALEHCDAPSPAVERCIERAGGHPLFLEQLLRTAELADDFDASDDVPGAIEAIVLARLDKLSPSDRDALEAAAVLGQRFSPEALRSVLGVGGYDCAALVAHDLLQPHGADYLFAHALVQEAIYGAILLSRRRELHRRAAEWFAERDSALRAEHLERAADPAAAEAFLHAAGERLRQLDFDHGLRLVERGLCLAAPSAVQHELSLLRGRIHHDRSSPQAAIESYRAALAAADAADRDDQRCRAWLGIATGMRLCDDYPGALEALARAEELARDRARERAQIHHQRGNVLFPLGDLDGCLREHRRSLALAQTAGVRDLEAAAEGGIGDASYLRGDMRAARAHFERCVSLSRELGLHRTEVANWPMLGWARAYLGELEAALADGAAAAELARRISHPRAEMIALHLVGWTALELGDPSRAAPAVARVRTIAEALGSQRFIVQALVWETRLAHAQGNASGAAELAERAARARRPTDSSYNGAFTLGAYARFAQLADDAREAALAEGEALLAHGCAVHNHLWFYRDAIEAALEREDWYRAERYVRALLACTPAPLPWSERVAARARARYAAG